MVCVYEICGLGKVSLNHSDTRTQTYLWNVPWLHLPGIFWVEIPLCLENVVYSISDSVRWSRLAGSDFSEAIITTTAASLLSSTLHSPKCDWWKCPAWPSSVSWHTAEGKDSCEGGAEGRKGVEDVNLSMPLQISTSRVYTLHNM